MQLYMLCQLLRMEAVKWKREAAFLHLPEASARRIGIEVGCECTCLESRAIAFRIRMRIRVRSWCRRMAGRDSTPALMPATASRRHLRHLFPGTLLLPSAQLSSASSFCFSYPFHLWTHDITVYNFRD